MIPDLFEVFQEQHLPNMQGSQSPYSKYSLKIKTHKNIDLYIEINYIHNYFLKKQKMCKNI